MNTVMPVPFGCSTAERKKCDSRSRRLGQAQDSLENPEEKFFF
jgi:hypothetical protein